jgi:hypothetical protein
MATTTLPMADDNVNGIYLVIPVCPLCGLTHRHGSVAPGHYQAGDITTRISHCARHQKDIAIRVIADVGPGGIVPGVSKRRTACEMPCAEMVAIPDKDRGAR